MTDNVKNWFKGLNREEIMWGIAGIILLILAIMFFAGVNLKDILLVGRKGTVKIELPLAQTNIFIDEEKKITTTKENENVEISLSPRRHSIIISREGYYPWTKDFVVPNNKSVTLSPVFVSINTTGQIITKNDPEYLKIRRAIIEKDLPTELTQEISVNGDAELWMDDNAIMVSIASTTYTVLQPDTVIRSVSFYRDRSDVVIFSTSNAIYAIEVNKEGKQNFMPIYKGGSPSFIKNDINSIYVWDNESLMQVAI